jgi:hypothetical protein
MRKRRDDTTRRDGRVMGSTRLLALCVTVVIVACPAGGGDLVLDRYDPQTRRWERLQDRLIDGEGERNAYWQATVTL